MVGRFLFNFTHECMIGEWWEYYLRDKVIGNPRRNELHDARWMKNRGIVGVYAIW